MTGSASAPASIELVMVHYGDTAPTRDALAAVPAVEWPALGLTLVDNGPGARADALDGAVAALDRVLPRGARLVRADTNLGFGGGVRLGVERCSSASEAELPELVLVLNHDVIVEPRAVVELVAFLEREPRALAVGPAILDAASDGLVWNAGSDIEWPHARPRSRFHGRSVGELPREPFEVGYLAGCATLVRTPALERLGGYPDDYFLYFEDAELGERIRAVGGASFVVPAARVRHRAGSATSENPRQAAYYRTRNRLLFSRRWGRGLAAAAARWWFAARRLSRGGASTRGACDALLALGRSGR